MNAIRGNYRLINIAMQNIMEVSKKKEEIIICFL